MKKITLSFIAIFCGFLFVSAQTTLEVGADKTYTSIKAAWDAAKSVTATDIIINVAEGTYVEIAEMTGAAISPATATIANKKITIRGAGADKTIVKRSTITDFAINSATTVNPGRLFQLNAAVAAGVELTLEKMTFQTIGYMDTNGGAVINSNQANQKFTVTNCNFKNIFARTGSIIQAATNTTGGVTSGVAEVKFENCFFEECGTFDNNSHEGLMRVISGTFSITNCSFYNNSFNAINKGSDATGTDRNLKVGQIMNLGGALSSATINNCDIVGNKYINADVDKVHPMISLKPATTGTAPNLTLTNTSTTYTLSSTILVGNSRSSSADVDMYYNSLSVPTATSSVMNSVKNYDPNSVTVPVPDLDVTTLTGMTISPTAAISTYYEMDGTAPKIIINSLGVKTLVRKSTGVKNVNTNNLKVNVVNGELTITSDKLENIEIYNSIGAKIGQFLNTNHVQTNLSKGIYIVKSNTFSTKVLVR